MLDGNEATALVAHRLSEVVAIYPITPASAMGELADAWSSAGRTNLWGAVPEVVEMQSEAGAAAVLHGAAQKGSLAVTFTASQGLLLMIPELYRLAGELLPAVFHVAARAVATHALSIFGDHSDVMAVRQTGVTMLCSATPQEAHDLALIAHATALETRVPVLHFFDGFRTSHEVARVETLDDDDLRALVSEAGVLAQRARGLDPDHPVLRGSAQNPDVFFQAREAVSPYHAAVPAAVQSLFDRLGARTGRTYRLVEYVGDPQAERVVLLMGSGMGAVRETVRALCARGERVGAVLVRLYRPFPAEMLREVLPESVRSLAVLDRTKEPGAVGEPLYQEVLSALAEGTRPLPRMFGGRYGLASKEFTPAMVEGIYEALTADIAPRHFTVGIVDDVSRTSLAYDRSFDTDTASLRALLYGIGSDGTVSAAKQLAKLAGERAGRHAQAYFVYDSRKSGQMTVSHVRVSDAPIESTYLIARANFIACLQVGLLERVDVLGPAEQGATVLLASSHEPDVLWNELPFEVQQAVSEKELTVYCIDAERVARESGAGERLSAVLLACFVELTGLLGGKTSEEHFEVLERSLRKAYGQHGEAAVKSSITAARASVAALRRVVVPTGHAITATHGRRAAVPEGSNAPDFVRRVTARMLEGEGDLLPVSAMPPDGTFPTGTARWDKRMLADTVPAWEPGLCIDCGKCTVVCPHAALRMKAYDESSLREPPEGFQHKPFRARELPHTLLTIQLAPDDCTGCGLCVEACPAHEKNAPSHRALAMEPIEKHRDRARVGFEYFEALASADVSKIAGDTVKGSQLRPARFEFPSACSGCGETPYLKLLAQLYGDRLLVANATGCSSIFGGNLPTTPWSVGPDGRGPAWANSLFEDNAEFGLGMRLAYERQADEARRLCEAHAGELGDELVRAVSGDEPRDESGVAARRRAVDALRDALVNVRDEGARARLAAVLGNLVPRSVWIVGGDGWAYDIGFGGLDHVLASGRDVNVLVLDTEVYSNTGGQASKATPRGALAKFAASGKRTAKKDLGRMALTYEGVYVAQIAMGADDRHTVRALTEAAAWNGPSLVIAYCPCIAHGVDLCASLSHQSQSVESGHFPIYRYDPASKTLKLGVHERTVDLAEFERSEARFGVNRSDLGDQHTHLLTLSEHDVAVRWHALELLEKKPE